MLGFVTDELVWAIRREREEEARNTRPHTSIKPDPERTTHEHTGGDLGLYAGPTLRAGAHGVR